MKYPMNDDRTILNLPHGRLRLPTYLPDATLGVVRSVDAIDLLQCKIEGVVMNAFHLMQRPGSSTVQALGGLHTMSGWQGPIITDSGGFQAYSLIHENPKYGTLTDNGMTVRTDRSARKVHLTPEKSVQLQLSYDTDVVICLDDCTHAEAPLEVQEQSVKRTIAWARRCKTEFNRILNQRRIPMDSRPLLFAVIQGGALNDLRKYCAEELLAIEFDGYGYGGWPLDSQGNLLIDVLAYTRELVPREYPMHALGIGHPCNVRECAKIGYGLFDSAMPTRDARHGRLYTFAPEVRASRRKLEGKWFTYLYINDEKHIKANRPVSHDCDAVCCTHYSLGYLHHLFKINDALYLRLATIHNLRFMSMLMDGLRAQESGE